jgi:translation initiation factor IF-2
MHFVENNTEPTRHGESEKEDSREASALKDTNETEDEDTPAVIPFPIIIKADVQGSVEALLDSIFSLPSHEVKVQVVFSGVGPITESDLDLAAATKASIFTFNIKQSRKLLAAGENLNIPIFQHSIIYSFLGDLKDRMAELLPPEKVYSTIGEAEILELFQLRGKMAQKIAGCKVKTGKILKSGITRILRNNQPIYDGI